VIAQHVTVMIAAHANSTIADHADLAVIAQHVTVMIADVMITAHANSTIADHADHAPNAVIAQHVIVMIAAHANSTIADHADLAVIAQHVTVMIAAHANSTIADHADHAPNAATDPLATEMHVLLADLAVKAPILAVIAPAVVAHANAAPSVQHVALRQSVQFLSTLVGNNCSTENIDTR
jgi:hypothetical protein